MIYRPHTIQGKVILNKMSGTGMGSVLLDKGGSGSGSSYTSMSDYLATTNGGGMKGGDKGMRSKGLGVGGAIEDKLSKLVINPLKDETKRKKNNIKFSL